ncbi:MAG: ParB/RepB/Spo0J family partition protein, partial [Firmicutes bacterium]|nr:ParB/RepB/Spo0J family partition protein [Bacillota bacterium]
DREALEELTESIRQHGVLQPIAVRKIKEGHYQIIAGERRWRAAREAGLKEIPVHIVDADDRTAMELALVENLQRRDLNPIEEAEGYKTLIEEYNLTQEQAAERVGKSRPAVANAMRLLALAPGVRELVSNGTLSAGHAKALLALQDKDAQLKASETVILNGLNVRQTELLVKKLLEADKKAAEKKPGKITVNYLEDIERRLSSHLGRKVKFIPGRKKGKIELEYYDNNDLDALIEILEKIARQSN